MTNYFFLTDEHTDNLISLFLILKILFLRSPSLAAVAGGGISSEPYCLTNTTSLGDMSTGLKEAGLGE
mgnify:CR=1 FL=1